MDRQVNTENEINFDSLSDYLRERYEDRQVNICESTQMYGMLRELVVELLILKPNTIGELAKALDRTKEAFEQFEKYNSRNKVLGTLYFPIEVVIISMQLLFDDFPEFMKRVADPNILAEYKEHILSEEN